MSTEIYRMVRKASHSEDAPGVDRGIAFLECGHKIRTWLTPIIGDLIRCPECERKKAENDQL